MEELTIRVPPDVKAKLDAWTALYQSVSPGIDLSGVLTRWVRDYPWAQVQTLAHHDEGAQ